MQEGGIPLPGPETTTCGVMSSEPIAKILARPEVMRVNWGQGEFQFAPPPDFKPYGEGVAY
jgi:hypothetical protein